MQRGCQSVALHQIRIECRLAPRQLTIIECHAPWHEDSGPEWTSIPIARLHYSAADKSWTVYWRDRNLSFHLYDQMAPARHVEDLLNELNRDPPASSTDNPRARQLRGASLLPDLGWVSRRSAPP